MKDISKNKEQRLLIGLPCVNAQVSAHACVCVCMSVRAHTELYLSSPILPGLNRNRKSYHSLRSLSVCSSRKLATPPQCPRFSIYIHQGILRFQEGSKPQEERDGLPVRNLPCLHFLPLPSPTPPSCPPTVRKRKHLASARGACGKRWLQVLQP